MIENSKRCSFRLEREELRYSDMDILRTYLGISKVPCMVSSPLRNDDLRPSFSFFPKGDMVFWKDFGTGEKGTTVGLLAKLWNVSYSDALLKIKLDTERTSGSLKLTRNYHGKIHVVRTIDMKIQTRPWETWDREYWGKYGITELFATWCNAHPVSHAFFTKYDEASQTTSEVCVPMDKFGYAYVEWKDGKQSIKLYQPFSKRMKWLSKHDASVWDLWKHAFRWASERSNESCIITSSRKDAMCLWANLQVPCMALQGEGYLPKPQVMQQVLDTFKNVYLWYDNDFSHENDNPGQDNAAKLIQLYPALKNICIPSELRCKDPSDLVAEWGVEPLKDIWQQHK